MDDSIWALILTIGIDIILFSLEFCAFSIYRKYRNKPINLKLEEREIKVPIYSESDTPLRVLFKNVWKIPFSEMSYYSGIEGQLYLALHLVLGGGMIAFAVLGCGILIPVYAYYGESEIDKSMNYISMAHILDQYDIMAVVLVFFVLFTILMFVVISAYIGHASTIHSKPSELVNTINKYTFEIWGIPSNIKPPQATKEVFELLRSQYGNDIQSVYIVPDLADAAKIKLELDEAKARLQHFKDYYLVKGEYAKISPKLCGEKIDAIQYYETIVKDLTLRLNAATEYGKNESSGIAYVLCKSPIVAFNVVQKFQGKKDSLNSCAWNLHLAPAPGEINWHNMTTKRHKLWVTRLMLWITFIICFFLLITPSTLLQILVELLDLVGAKSIYQGAISQLVPSLILLLYQSAIVRVSVNYIVKKEELGNKSEETVSALFKFLLVMVTYTFIVPLVGFQVYSIITNTLLGEFDRWKTSQANIFAYEAQFFTIFMIHMTFFKNGADFMQIPKLIRVKFRQRAAVNETERMLAYEAYEFRWAYEYGISISSLIIILSFSVAYPIILVVGAAFFISRYWTAKYNLLCFYCTVKTTTADRIPRMMTRYLLVATLFFQLMTCYFLFLSNSITYFAISIVLIILSIIIFTLVYWKSLDIEKVLKLGFSSETFEEEGLIFDVDIEKYYHPLETRKQLSLKKIGEL
ncbi:TMEM63C_2 [Blepharisma stoltei]|uniref:Uncharacterized protein n=1 Tax=Blepharisma stoltei TaxID=1481888 RepID=A0AAU9JH87_9CILI|nr:unnamed protein product [Blepharisma stoltei]